MDASVARALGAWSRDCAVVVAEGHGWEGTEVENGGGVSAVTKSMIWSWLRKPLERPGERLKSEIYLWNMKRRGKKGEEHVLDCTDSRRSCHVSRYVRILNIVPAYPAAATIYLCSGSVAHAQAGQPGTGEGQHMEIGGDGASRLPS